MVMGKELFKGNNPCVYPWPNAAHVLHQEFSNVCCAEHCSNSAVPFKVAERQFHIACIVRHAANHLAAKIPHMVQHTLQNT